MIKYLYGQTGANGELLSLQLYNAKNKTNIYKNLAKKTKQNTAEIYGIAPKDLDNARKNLKEFFNLVENQIESPGKFLIPYVISFLKTKSKYKNIKNISDISKILPKVQNTFSKRIELFEKQLKRQSIERFWCSYQ
jgi:hypothetical protein